jgi:hypothetical protein
MARVWLVAGLAAVPAPVDGPVLRDDLMRTWEPDQDASASGADAGWHTVDGRHHATWRELHGRYDLVEVA